MHSRRAWQPAHIGRSPRRYVTTASSWDGRSPLCLAKALTSGVAPLAAVLATAEIEQAAEGELSFYATFGWHPLAVEAAIATLEHWKRHGDEILDNVADRSNQILTRLSVRLPEQAELHIAGLAVAIDFGDEDLVERIARRCRRAGLLVAPEEELLELFPALTIDRDTLAEALDVLEAAISAG